MRAPPDEIPESVSIPGGQFQFGFAVDRKTSSVSISPFAISKTPTTVGQYTQCVAAGACSAPSLSTAACRGSGAPAVMGATYDASPDADRLPVTCATPSQTVEYCAWVGGSLPTVEQWIYAARGPTVQQFSWGNAGPDCNKHPRALPPFGDLAGCCSGSTCDPIRFYAVGQHPEGASPTGILDVLLTPAEMLRGHNGAPLGACSGGRGACVVRSLLAGSIDTAQTVSPDVSGDAYADPGVAVGFRCVFEVTSK
jgi:hypothetical protein